ncbi:phospholipase D-like domain-containing protein [Limnobacter parvus]|uniref:Cardiolipin synthase B n=1 Tax=Limnobacter parvus TaxID=2939690 RepID=A0ABT1XF49_9BURK|nr:phospholipase D-like domain-containing protein [Limnobacter parvus]MCR2745902.1 phospholipase D-like domain-containing protein [Limnobacter parvus]
MALKLLPASSPEREGNAVELLKGGAQLFPAALNAIEQAQQEVRIETYIFADDAAGEAFFNAMCDAVERGVKVQLVLDGFGGHEGVRTWVPSLLERGVQVRVFRPENFMFTLNPRRLRRMHRKIIAVDNSVAFVGGINLIDDMNHDGERDELLKATERAEQKRVPSWAASGGMRANAMAVNKELLDQTLGPRYDFAVQLQGPVVQDVWHNMEWLWLQIGPGGRVTDTFSSSWWKERVEKFQRALIRQRAAPTPKKLGKVKVQLAVRDNFRLRRRIERAYVQALGKAQRNVILSNAYFLPGRTLHKAILTARKRGVRVQLLLQGRVEYRFQHYATQSLYSSLLNAGVEIYEYLPSFLHAKVAVVDAQWATVGSANLDPLSSLFAREANVIVYNREFAVQLRDELVNAIENDSRQIQPHEHAERSVKERVYSWVCYKLMLLAVFLGGFGSRY